jgi:glycosyltransferase involved in cell wall biosynthesis
MQIKIAFLISSFRTGGKERFTADILRQLDRARFDPFLCVMKGGELLDTIADQRVYANLALFRGDVFGVGWRLWRVFRREQPQIIVAVGNRLDSWWGRLIGAWMGIPVRILELHGVRVVGKPPFLPPDRWLKRLTTHYIAIGPDLRDQLIQREGIPPEKITLILNGVDTDKFSPKTPEDIARIKQECFQVPPNAPVIGCVAGLRHEKNLILLIEAAAQIPEVHLVIIGEGPERPRLEACIAQLGIQNRAHLLGLRQDVAALVPAFDAAALTSVTEATPLMVMEAAACGVPVVATAVGSIPDMIQDGKTGFLVFHREELVQKLVKLLSHPEQRQQMGQAARRHALENFSLQASTAARERLFSQLLEDRPPRL